MVELKSPSGRSISQLASMLDSFSDQQLNTYAQNPSGLIPQWLVISKLEERKAARDALGAPPMPQATVAQQLVQQAAPPPLQGVGSPPPGAMPPPSSPPPSSPPPPIEGGVASLPAPEMEYKQGGIVSFDEGGPAYFQNPMLQGLKDLVKKMSPYTHGEDEVERPIGFRTGPYGDMIPVYASDKKAEPVPERTDRAGPPESAKSPAVPPARPEVDDSGFSAYQVGSGGMDMAGIKSILPDINPEDMPKLSEKEAPEEWKGFAANKEIEKEADTAYGVDPDFYQKMLERAQGEESEIKSAKRDAMLGDLAAGFSAMAQTPGSFGTGLAAGLSKFGEELDETTKLYRDELKDARKYQDTIRMADQESRTGRKKDAMRAREDTIKARRDFNNSQKEREDARAMEGWKAGQTRKEQQADLAAKMAQVRATEANNIQDRMAAAAQKKEQRLFDMQKFIIEQMGQGTEGTKAAQRWVENRMVAGAIPQDIKDSVTKDLKANKIDITTVDAQQLNALYYEKLMEEARSVVNGLNAHQRASNAERIRMGFGLGAPQ